MLKFGVFLCVLQLGAATPSMCESDFAENEIPPSSSKSSMLGRDIYVLSKKQMWYEAEDYYRKAALKKHKIEQEAASPDQVERLRQASEEVAIAYKKMWQKKEIYKDAFKAAILRGLDEFEEIYKDAFKAAILRGLDEFERS